MKFSVLLSVYARENPLFFEAALESVLVVQTVLPDELVLVKDGPLTAELDAVIRKYSERFPDIVRVVALETNCGLGEALRVGTLHCSHPLVARMDSDDLSVPNRFEIQCGYLSAHPEVSAVGGYIEEFYETPDRCLFLRETPTTPDGVKDRIKKRNPMNHVTVMFRRDDVLQAGGYQPLHYLEDYYLWARMLGEGFRLDNLPMVLVKVRTGKGMYRRRADRKSIAGWDKLQAEMRSMGLQTRTESFLNRVLYRAFVWIPPGMKEKIYGLFFRRKADHGD